MLKTSRIAQKRRDFLLLAKATACMLCPGAITQGQFVSGALELAQEPAKSCHQVGQAKGGFNLSVPSTSKVPHASTHHLSLPVAPLAVAEVGVTPVGS